MRRRTAKFASAAFVLCAVLMTLLWPEKPELVFKGKRLSEWLDQIAVRSTVTPDVAEALQAIATNGIPCYMHWISYQPSLIKRIVTHVCIKTGIFPIVGGNTAKEERCAFAIIALEQLGERGAPAIPQLLTYLKSSATEFPSSGRASALGIEALGTMGGFGMSAYFSLVTSKDARVRALAIGQGWAFSRSHFLCPEQISQFQKALNDPDFQVRVTATNALKLYSPAVTNANKL